MCYSAKIASDYKKYVRHYGAKVRFDEFIKLFVRREDGEKIIIPKGTLDAFKQIDIDSADAQTCREHVLAIERADAIKWEQQLTEQRERLAKAESKLALKHTQTWSEHLRIAQDKIDQALAKLDDLERSEPKERDERIFPGSFCPVMVRDETGELWVRPMRYQLRPFGLPPSFDRTHPGTYNARLTSLEGFWSKIFGFQHALVMAEAFFEHVPLHRWERRELEEGEEPTDVILRFAPQDNSVMEVACLWDRWTGREGTLDSFAAITSEPPPEVETAGHDRCIIPLKPNNVADWLAAPARQADHYLDLLDDKQRPYYEHLKIA